MQKSLKDIYSDQWFAMGLSEDEHMVQNVLFFFSRTWEIYYIKSS